MVIYEWGDYEMLGKVTSMTEEGLPVRVPRASAAAPESLTNTISRKHTFARQMQLEAASAPQITWANS